MHLRPLVFIKLQTSGQTVYMWPRLKKMQESRFLCGVIIASAAVDRKTFLKHLTIKAKDFLCETASSKIESVNCTFSVMYLVLLVPFQSCIWFCNPDLWYK